jgi:hypothetical protein
MTEPVAPVKPVVLEVAPARIVQTDPTQVGKETPRQQATLWFDPNWRDFHKLWSMRVQFILMGFTAAYMAVPAFISWLPPRLFALIVVVMIFSGGIFRLMNQKGVDL